MRKNKRINKGNKNNKNNKVMRKSNLDDLDINGLLNMAGLLGTNEAKGSNSDGHTPFINDLFNLGTQVMKQSSMSDLLSRLDQNDLDSSDQDKKENKQTSDLNTTGILNMVTGLLDNTEDDDLEDQIKKLQNRVNIMEKELSEIKQELSLRDTKD